MITLEGKLMCDKCGQEVDLLTSHSSNASHFCDRCIRLVFLYFGTEKMGKYVLYPDGIAKVYIWGKPPYWAEATWEKYARLGEAPFVIPFQMSRPDEQTARKWAFS